MRLPPDLATPAATRREETTDPSARLAEHANAESSAQDAGTRNSAPPPPAASGAVPAGAADDTSEAVRLFERVRIARTLAKMTKAELARRVGVCLSAAVQWEHPNGTSPTVANLVRIATLCGIAFEWLATGRGSPELADALNTPAIGDEDIDFEIRLLQAARGVPRERREFVVEFARSIVEE
jgi:transcriptional regulator with XRE-family HTH domain